MLIVVATFAILVAMLYLPTLSIYGKSMKGMLDSGDVVLTVKSNHFRTGDIVAFYYNNNCDIVNITSDIITFCEDINVI